MLFIKDFHEMLFKVFFFFFNVNFNQPSCRQSSNTRKNETSLNNEKKSHYRIFSFVWCFCASNSSFNCVVFIYFCCFCFHTRKKFSLFVKYFVPLILLSFSVFILYYNNFPFRIKYSLLIIRLKIFFCFISTSFSNSYHG